MIEKQLHWSNEIIAETSCSLQVNSLEDMVAGSHHFTHCCMTVCGMHLTIISPVLMCLEMESKG